MTVSMMHHDTFERYSASWPADFVLQVALVFMDKHKHDAIDQSGFDSRLEGYLESESDVWR